LLARTYPELAVLVKDISTGWVLELLTRYPTARLLAQAAESDVQAIPYLPHGRVDELLAAARDSIGSLSGAVAEDLVRDQSGRSAMSPPGKSAWKACSFRRTATCRPTTTWPPSQASAT
jgi:hypothetical protein